MVQFCEYLEGDRRRDLLRSRTVAMSFGFLVKANIGKVAAVSIFSASGQAYWRLARQVEVELQLNPAILVEGLSNV